MWSCHNSPLRNSDNTIICQAGVSDKNKFDIKHDDYRRVYPASYAEHIFCIDSKLYRIGKIDNFSQALYCYVSDGWTRIKEFLIESSHLSLNVNFRIDHRGKKIFALYNGECELRSPDSLTVFDIETKQLNTFRLDPSSLSSHKSMWHKCKGHTITNLKTKPQSSDLCTSICKS